MIENKETLKRFCYALSTENEVVQFSSCFLKKNKNSIWAITSFECYNYQKYYVVILEIQSWLNVSDILKKLDAFSENKKNGFKLSEKKLLKRIFKKNAENKKISSNKLRNKRFVMTLMLKENRELLEAYKEIHKPDKIWPEIIENMNTMGIQEMEIYLQGCQAFLIMDTSPNFDLDKDGQKWASLPREKEWQEYVAKFQKVNPKSKAVEKWKQMALLIQQ